MKLLPAPLGLWIVVSGGVACAPAVTPNVPPVTTASLQTKAATAPTGSALPAIASGYDKPPQPLLDVLHTPATPTPHVSPTGDRILLSAVTEYPPMSRVAEPYLKLAGVRVEPRNHSKHDTAGGYGVRPCIATMSIAQVDGSAETPVDLPKGTCPYSAIWSADGAKFAFQNAAADAVELWVGDAATGKIHRLEGVALNPIFGSTVQFMPDQRSLFVKLVPEGLGAPPPAPLAPPGPSIQETGGEKGESSTYETRDTLTNKHDEALFDYYGAAQLAIVDASTGAATKVGKTGIYADVDVSPDGAHVLVAAIQRPYSYVTTYDRFARDIEVWDLAGGAPHTMAKIPLSDRVPVHGVPIGPREFDWRSTEPATLTWAEALDGGDWKTKVPARDKVMMQKAPFTAPPTELIRTEQRFVGFAWGATPSLAFLHEDDENRHWRRVFTMNVDDGAAKPSLLWDLSSDERYKNPGSPVMMRLPNGAWVVRQEGDAVFLEGVGSSPAGDRPFLDRLTLGTKKTERLFRSERNAYESFLAFRGKDTRSLITWHQSPVDPPNAFLRTLGKPLPPVAGEPSLSSTTVPVTHMPDPTPTVRAIKKRLVKYKRKDGVELSFSLYTPPNYKEGERLPTILNAYPLDYADPAKAGQISGSEQTFTRLRQYRLMLLAGYAVIDSASFPIVGDPKNAYDTYLEQLVDDAKAAVDKGVELGVVDPKRVGVTGHSHGALMTANLLAHSDLFKAGVATSGSYNKTLTPFGFQNERRSVWEAPEVYRKASTFFFADKLKTPILIMHGEDDANPGTTPLQAKKLFEAIRGNGGTARLVMLPHEPHWYSAMESNEQYVAEMLRWFDKYVKNAR